MKRITDPGSMKENTIASMTADQMEAVYKKLWEYENTGITPEQFEIIDEEYSKMAYELNKLR